jgi:hypothetical protein
LAGQLLNHYSRVFENADHIDRALTSAAATFAAQTSGDNNYFDFEQFVISYYE